MNKKINQTGILYLCLYNLLKRKHGLRIINKKEVFCELGKHFLVPKPLKLLVIQEMEDKKLIKVLDRDNFQVCKCDHNIEEDINHFFNY